MYSHIHIGTSSIEKAAIFYDAVLTPLGITRKFMDTVRGWAGWQGKDKDRPLFLVGRPFDENAQSVGNGQMVAFLASSRAQVDGCYDVAIAAGAISDGKPGLRPEYHPNYYGAYFFDLDGNKICICCHDAI